MRVAQAVLDLTTDDTACAKLGQTLGLPASHFAQLGEFCREGLEAARAMEAAAEAQSESESESESEGP